jgi:hypothetical protein
MMRRVAARRRLVAAAVLGGCGCGCGWGAPLAREPPANVEAKLPAPERPAPADCVDPAPLEEAERRAFDALAQTSTQAATSGALRPQVIAAAVDADRAAIRACFERGRRYAPDLSGDVSLALIVDASGAVERAAVHRTTLNSEPVEMCLLSRACAWSFPAPGEPVQVVLPLTFTSPP